MFCLCIVCVQIVISSKKEIIFVNKYKLMRYGCLF